MIECSGTGDCLLIRLLTPIEAGIVSHSGNRYAQAYAHRNTWCNTYPMEKKSDAHETLSLMFCIRMGPKHSGNGWSEQTGYG